MFLIQKDGVNYQVFTEQEAKTLGLDWQTAQPLLEGVMQIPEFLALDDKTADDVSSEEAKEILADLAILIGENHPATVELTVFLYLNT